MNDPQLIPLEPDFSWKVPLQQIEIAQLRAELDQLRTDLAAATARAEAAEAERDNLAAVIANLPNEAIALAQHIWQQETQS